MHLIVNNVYRSIQLEGQYAGHPAVFVRMQGCSVGCAYCNVKGACATNMATEVSMGEVMGKVSDAQTFAVFTVEQLVDHIKAIASPNKLVVITGGEPLEQDIGKFIYELNQEGFVASIETSGTTEEPYWLGASGNECYLTVSIKNIEGGKKTQDWALDYGDVIIYPISTKEDADEFKKLIADPDNEIVYNLQALNRNPKSIQVVYNLSIETGYPISLISGISK